MNNIIANLENLQDADTIAKFRKENHFYKEVKIVSFDKETNEFKTPLFARYYATQATHYCCLWLTGDPGWYSGGGKAGGFGYHRESAALANAFESVGLLLDRSISGTGEEREAMEAIARALNLENYTIMYSHA